MKLLLFSTNQANLNEEQKVEIQTALEDRFSEYMFKPKEEQTSWHRQKPVRSESTGIEAVIESANTPEKYYVIIGIDKLQFPFDLMFTEIRTIFMPFNFSIEELKKNNGRCLFQKAHFGLSAKTRGHVLKKLIKVDFERKGKKAKASMLDDIPKPFHKNLIKE